MSARASRPWSWTRGSLVGLHLAQGKQPMGPPAAHLTAASVMLMSPPFASRGQPSSVPGRVLLTSGHSRPPPPALTAFPSGQHNFSVIITLTFQGLVSLRAGIISHSFLCALTCTRTHTPSIDTDPRPSPGSAVSQECKSPLVSLSRKGI